MGCEHDLGPWAPCLELSHLIQRHFHCSEDCWQRCCIDMRPRCWSLDQQLWFLPVQDTTKIIMVSHGKWGSKFLPSNHLVKSDPAVQQVTSSPILDLQTRLTIFTFGGAIRATCSCYANIVLKLDADYRCTFTVLFSYKLKKMDTCDMIKSLTWPDTKLCPKPTTQTATVQKSTLWLSLPPFWFEWHFSVYISPPDFW